MLRAFWLFLAAGNFAAVALDYLSNSWPLFFANATLGFLFAYLALKPPSKQLAGDHEDE